MALRALMLNHKRSRLQAERDAIPDRSKEFAEREAQLEAAINEAAAAETRDAEAEAVLTAEVEAFDQERDAHNAEIARLDGEIADLTRQIQEEEANAPKPPAAEPTPIDTTPTEERKEDSIMPNNRCRILGLTRSEFAAAVKREDSQKFLARIKELAQSHRSISGADLLIPDYWMGIIRENVPLYSKLYKHCFVRQLHGTGRITVMGTIPEGIWTEMCAKLNELNLSFSAVELDGYKVGGFIPVCNALLEDADIDLAQEVLVSITKGIALALDKAILYGTGTKMPLGIVTRLAQTAQPENYGNSLKWEDYHESNMKSLGNKTGTALFQALLSASGAINTDYSDGGTFWAMNRKTKMKLMEQSLGVNANGAIVAGMNNTMPVEGGTIETLSFIPDDVIIGGVDGLYALLERSGIRLKTFEQTLAIQDQTLFIGTARYDGLPVIADGFVAISLGTTVPTANAVTFSQDKANTAAA